jgi:pimeloyl-ACP methyl ester carboxylesterase
MRELKVPVDRGQGLPLVLLHGYAMRPITYGPLADLLAERCRVIVPDLFNVPGRWSAEKVLDALVATLDSLGLDQVSVLGHSFGGGIEGDLASRAPQRVVELVFSDTLAVSKQFRLADEALRHPTRILRLATPPAASAFLWNWVRHPPQMVEAALWGFASGRSADDVAISCDGIPCHVLWADRDSVLSRSDGERFAHQLGASFTVAQSPDGRPLDHDWMFEQPEIFMGYLDELGLKVLAG